MTTLKTRPAGNGRYQAWLGEDGWYIIAPDGSTDDAVMEGTTPQESRRLAARGVQRLNEELRKRTIRDFLALPPEALPAASWLRGDVANDIGDPWPYLRDSVLPSDQRRLNSFGLGCRLHADRDGWRGGVVVEV
jgi:hypothetical protein